MRPSFGAGPEGYDVALRGVLDALAHLGAWRRSVGARRFAFVRFAFARSNDLEISDLDQAIAPLAADGCDAGRLFASGTRAGAQQPETFQDDLAQLRPRVGRGIAAPTTADALGTAGEASTGAVLAVVWPVGGVVLGAALAMADASEAAGVGASVPPLGFAQADTTTTQAAQRIPLS